MASDHESRSQQHAAAGAARAADDAAGEDPGTERFLSET